MLCRAVLCRAVQAVHLATAVPTTGPGLIAAASSSISITVNGCPGAVASLTVSDLQLQLLQPVAWNVTSTSAVDPLLGALQLDSSSSRDVAYSIRYLAMPQPQVKQLTGTVAVANVGRDMLQLQQIFVEVVPLGVAHLGSSPLVLPVTCPIDSSSSSSSSSSSTAGDAAAIMQPMAAAVVAAGAKVYCSFEGALPEGLTGPAAVTARVLQRDGSSTASAAISFDLSQQPQRVVSAGRCAVVSDGFVGGRGRVVPVSSSRPAAAAAASRICGSQTVSFVASLGPFGEAACGKKLWVSRVCRTGRGLLSRGGAAAVSMEI